MIFNCLSIVTIFCLVSEISSLSCLEVKRTYEKTCLESEQDNYVQCVRTRMKRHPHDCELNDNCYECDCESCSYSECGGQCDQCCHSCCTNYVQCHTNHCCHRQCHAECRTYNCRSSCRMACYEAVEREKQSEIPSNQERIETFIQGSGVRSSSNQESQVNNTNAHNITTIINLKNVLNNTNFLDVPINLTYSNKNNITLHEAANAFQNGGTGDNCCIVIGPRQCVAIQISPFTRCFHTRSRQCGPYCSANIVHEESKQICNSVNSLGQPTNCQQQTSYIPQPKPRCTYTSTWPYVACGIQPPTVCDGCYGHYFNSQVKNFKSCPPQCYDDFSVGPLYRQGPFYQPGYSHVPPCAYSPQGCGGGFGGMGGYGFGGGMTGIGLSPGFGGFGQFPGGYGYGYGQGYGGGFGSPFSPPTSPFGFPVQQNPWIPPYFGTSLNTTLSNGTILNMTDLIEPQIFNQYQDDLRYIPLNQDPDKEVEIDMAITGPDETKLSQHSKRGAKNNHKKTDDISVITVY